MQRLGPSRWLVLWLMLFPLIVSTACLTPAVGTPAATAPVASSPAASPAAATPTTGGVVSSPAPTSIGSATAEGTAIPSEFDYGPGTFVLTDTKTGLAALASYTASVTVAFEGTRAGQPLHFSKTTVMVAGQQPAARQVTIQRTGEAAPGTVLIQVGGTTYERHGDSGCTATAVVPGALLADRYEPAASLDSVVGADDAGTETVNSVLAKHYTFDERALGRQGFSKSTGEVWVAAEGGYIVKYVLTTKAGPEFFGPNTEGTITWEYQLSGANQPVTIEVPQDCPAGLIDVPLLPDAANVRSLPGVLTYDSATPPAEAGGFYQDKLPALGWELANTTLITDTAALLDFSQGHSRLTVMVAPQQDHTAVRIVQTR